MSESVVADAAMVEYLQPEVGNFKVDQKNLHACWVKDGYWVDVHVSQMAYKEADRDRLVGLIRAIEFMPKSGMELKNGLEPAPKK